MKKILILLTVVMLAVISCTQEKFSINTNTDTNGYKYKTVKGDPFNVREYQLDNGLKVFLSENKEKPEISTMIAVRAGSTYDPKETTGLAHYLEHLMFKGTDKFGTTNWEKEKLLLEDISEQFEKHKATSNEEEKRIIYSVIDSLSQEASKYAVFQEYSKMVSSIGATRTNAFTSYEQTVYVNTIPSNQIDKWLTLESERFSTLVLRLFHTELETVYEEFNSGQSSDYRQAYYKFNSLLFPSHPYGTQTTIGKAEHLKNPSLVNINNYWNKYYVANNMAIIMSGDINFDETIAKIDKHFGGLRRDDNLSHPTFPKEEPITEPIKEDVFGPDAESIQIGFRTEGVNNDKNIIAELIGMILYNGQAGLIDIDLVKKQKVLRAYAYNSVLKDYGMFTLSGSPLEGQTLEEVEELLLAQIEKIKKGDFEDWIQEAIINNEKLRQLRQIEYNYYIYSILQSFIQKEDWANNVARLDKMEKITKQQIIDYANETFKDNYVVVYKRKGENKTSVTVDKPKIFS
jgi:zinc protease